MKSLGLERSLVDADAYAHSVERFRTEGIVLPTFAELADPSLIPAGTSAAVRMVDRAGPHPLNLFRVHWYNRASETSVANVPEYLVLPKELTGTEARIVTVLGNRFPMIGAHKVLAAYACLAPRIVTGQFDPTANRAIWPSTGNYARGGVAISRIMGCRGIAVLPEHMSQERFRWLESWIADPADIIKTPGSESNVKEIYDACAELERDPINVVFNQFCEFPNHLAHYEVTGRALDRVYEDVVEANPDLRLRAFVAASGSGGTLGAGDYLKERHDALIVAVEALECPTMLYNGFGEHNIQGIGDKHIPLIHNVTNTDVVLGVSDRVTDSLDVLFNTAQGRSYLVERAGVATEVVEQLGDLGLSSICNIVAAVKLAKHLDLGSQDVILTVATDGSDLYASEREANVRRFGGERFDAADAARLHAEYLLAASPDNLIELREMDRRRIFNLGYYTWVEQQGVSVDEFDVRRDQKFWRGLRDLLPVWDEMIREFNARTGSADAT